MEASDGLDALFREAVAAIDAGDVPTLARLLKSHPRLVADRLEEPGPWLADRRALEDFFARPYLLWFVAEDPVRNGSLPPNISRVTRAIIEAARRARVSTLQEQLDYALRLVCWSWIARQCGVQIELIDTLLDAGASPDGEHLYGGRFGTHSDSAIYNGNFEAAEHLLARGARPTLSTALNLGRWDDVDRLFPTTTTDERQDALVQAARKGKAEALRRMLVLGASPNTASEQVRSHASALHHAAWSGSLEAVRVLIEGGADPSRRDTIYDGTPLEWAEHASRSTTDESRKKRLREIAELLRECARERR